MIGVQELLAATYSILRYDVTYNAYGFISAAAYQQQT